MTTTDTTEQPAPPRDCLVNPWTPDLIISAALAVATVVAMYVQGALGMLTRTDLPTAAGLAAAGLYFGVLALHTRYQRNPPPDAKFARRRS